MSSKMVSVKAEESRQTQTKQQERSKAKESLKSTFNFEKPRQTKAQPATVLPAKSGQSFELTTLTDVSRAEPKFPFVEKEEPGKAPRPMPQPRVYQPEIAQKEEEIVAEIPQPKPKVDDKIEIIESVAPKKPRPKIETGSPDITKEVAKITKHKALPEKEERPKITNLDEDFDEDADDLDKIKGNIMKVLTRLDQAEVE